MQEENGSLAMNCSVNEEERKKEKIRISLFHYAFKNGLAITKTANSILKALEKKIDSYEVRLHVDVDGGGTIEREELRGLGPGLTTIKVVHHEKNLGRASVSPKNLSEALDRTWACIEADQPELIILLEDDVRFFRVSKSWHTQVCSDDIYAIGSSDEKNKFSYRELLAIEAVTKREPFMLKWAATGGTHIRAKRYGEIADTMKDMAAEFHKAGIPLFFDKLLYAAFNRFQHSNISRNLVGDVSQGRLTRLGWRYPVVHGIKDT